VPLGELLGTSIEVADVEVELTDAVVDRPLPGGGAHVVADHSRAILRVPGVGVFAVLEGSAIRFEPDSAAVSPEMMSAWLHGAVAALLLAQRRRFALHASVVEVGGCGVAIAGHRRAGKSTAALRLVQRGHVLVTDDVSPLECGPTVTVHSFARPVHVWPEAAAKLGLDCPGARPIVPDHPKLAIPSGGPASAPLAAVVVLETSSSSATVSVARPRGVAASWLLIVHSYQGELLRDLFETELFAWAGAVASRVPVHVVTRPETGWTIDAVADAVERIAESA
jgi:HPr Serine kinase C-terminal domain